MDLIRDAHDKGRRKYPRIPVALEIRCEESSKPITFVSRDISLGGVFVETSHVFPVGVNVILQCKLPYTHGELRIQGQVVRHNQDSHSGVVDGMAIHFQDLTQLDKQIIQEYIEHTIHEDSKV